MRDKTYKVVNLISRCASIISMIYPQHGLSLISTHGYIHGYIHGFIHGYPYPPQACYLTTCKTCTFCLVNSTAIIWVLQRSPDPLNELRGGPREEGKEGETGRGRVEGERWREKIGREKSVEWKSWRGENVRGKERREGGEGLCSSKIHLKSHSVQSLVVWPRFRGFSNEIRYINLRFTYLLYLLTWPS